MAPQFHLRCSTLFLTGMEEVWAFKTDALQMKNELHPFLIGDAEPAEHAFSALRGGELPVHYRLQARLFGGLQLSDWPVTIVEFDPPTGFVDTSQNALVTRWRHEHRLEPTSEGVRYVDQVEFTPRLRPYRWVAAGIRELFLHRHRQAAKHLPTVTRATGIATLREMR